MKLINIETEYHADVLYKLLQEREQFESISHKAMPTREEHYSFVASRPYLHWYLIRVGFNFVGSVYLSKQRELGVAVFKSQRRKGMAATALKMMMATHPGEFLANINPLNEKSIMLFAELGFRHIQNTYRRD